MKRSGSLGINTLCTGNILDNSFQHSMLSKDRARLHMEVETDNMQYEAADAFENIYTNHISSHLV